MSENHHDLAIDHPEHKDKIHALKESDAHFKSLCDHYEELSKAIYRSENRIDLLSEEEEEQLRKKRVHLKDEIFNLLSAN